VIFTTLRTGTLKQGCGADNIEYYAVFALYVLPDRNETRLFDRKRKPNVRAYTNSY